MWMWIWDRRQAEPKRSVLDIEDHQGKQALSIDQRADVLRQALLRLKDSFRLVCMRGHLINIPVKVRPAAVFPSLTP